MKLLLMLLEALGVKAPTSVSIQGIEDLDDRAVSKVTESRFVLRSREERGHDGRPVVRIRRMLLSDAMALLPPKAGPPVTPEQRARTEARMSPGARALLNRAMSAAPEPRTGSDAAD